MNYKIDVKYYEDYNELNLQLAFLSFDSKNTDINHNNELKNKIKDLLLTNPRIKKSFEISNLKFNIKLIYSDEYINFYKGKRKITSN